MSVFRPIIQFSLFLKFLLLDIRKGQRNCSIRQGFVISRYSVYQCTIWQRILFIKCSFIQGWSDIFLFLGQKKQKKKKKTKKKMRKSQEILFHTTGFRYIEIFYQYTMGQRVLFITLKTSFYEVRIKKGQYTVLVRNPTREVPNVFSKHIINNCFWIHDSEAFFYSFFL